MKVHFDAQKAISRVQSEMEHQTLECSQISERDAGIILQDDMGNQIGYVPFDRLFYVEEGE